MWFPCISITSLPGSISCACAVEGEDTAVVGEDAVDEEIVLPSSAFPDISGSSGKVLLPRCFLLRRKKNSRTPRRISTAAATTTPIPAFVLVESPPEDGTAELVSVSAVLVEVGKFQALATAKTGAAAGVKDCKSADRHATFIGVARPVNPSEIANVFVRSGIKA